MPKETNKKKTPLKLCKNYPLTGREIKTILDSFPFLSFIPYIKSYQLQQRSIILSFLNIVTANAPNHHYLLPDAAAMF